MRNLAAELKWLVTDFERRHGVARCALSAAGHVGRHIRLPHRGQCDLVHCTMRIDPSLHVVRIVLVHLIGPLRRDDVPGAEIFIVASVKAELPLAITFIEREAFCSIIMRSSRRPRSGRVTVTGN